MTDFVNSKGERARAGELSQGARQTPSALDDGFCNLGDSVRFDYDFEHQYGKRASVRRRNREGHLQQGRQ